MRQPTKVGPYFDVVVAPSPVSPESSVKLGVKHESFTAAVLKVKLSTVVAQYYGIIQDGLRDAKHVFRGLERPLMRDEDMHGDQNVGRTMAHRFR